MIDDDAVLEHLIERIAAKAAALRRICPWCCATLANGEAFCTPVCAEDYRRKLMPPIGDERVIRHRPAARGAVEAMVAASRAAAARRRWAARTSPR